MLEGLLYQASLRAEKVAFPSRRMISLWAIRCGCHVMTWELSEALGGALGRVGTGCLDSSVRPMVLNQSSTWWSRTLMGAHSTCQ
jgi:hypothetical protein